MLRNVSAVAALGANGRSRARLAQAMLRANLKRLHRGWSRLTNRLLHAGPFAVQLALPERFPFWYRPGTTDLLALEQVFLEGEYDSPGIDPGAVEFIVDCGSNIGATALLWAKRFPNARMALVEPDEENFELLRRNTESFRDRCTLIRAAVSDRTGRTSLYRSNREYGHSIVQTDDCVSIDAVPALTMPAVLRAAEFPRIDLLKMDIEGGEHLVMRTLPTWNDTPRYLLAEIHPPCAPESFAAQCRQAGLEPLPQEAGREHLMFAARAA